MQARTLAHVSDLHIGLSRRAEERAADLCQSLLGWEVEHVVVTGDITHRGRHAELRRFEELFAPLLEQGKVTLVPGNHDRIGENAGERVMGAQRVDVRSAQGLHLVRVDSTGPHNRSSLASHGALCERVLDAIEAALHQAPAHSLTVILLHHHPVALPEEGLGEWLATRLGWPHASELEMGEELLRRASGRCDLVLHGHRHVPREVQLKRNERRPLAIYNAGSSTELQHFRLFAHAGGRLLHAPLWVDARSRHPSPAVRALPQWMEPSRSSASAYA